jgi:LuxR family maltose regulon positive regulatory protein
VLRDEAVGAVRERVAGAAWLRRERTFLHRTRLLRTLADTRSTPVVCLLAPGGYGKTTLLRQWVRDDDRPVVWVTPRDHADDESALVQQILDEMIAVGVVRQPVPLPPDSGALAWQLHVLPLVQQVVSHAPPFLLVIDEAESISGEHWDSLLVTLAGNLPAGGQLAIGTRGPIPASFARLHAEGAVRVLGADLLAFDQEEGADLLRLLDTPLSDDGVHAMISRTEGWPVAVYLSGLAAAQGHDPTLAGPASVAGLSDYFRTQILDRLDDDDADFLLNVSVLRSIDVTACDAVAASADSLARLQRLVSANHLLVPDEARPDCYQLHPLLATFLRDELRRRDPGAWREAHARASHAREEGGDLGGAVFHARLSGDDARLGRLVWSQAARLLTHGQNSVLQRWTEDVDETRLMADGRLALTCAYLSALKGDLDQAHRFRLAAAQLARRGAPLAPEVDLVTAMMAPESVGHLQQLTSSFIEARDDTDPWSTLAQFLGGVALMVSDRPAEATEAIRRAHHLSVAHDLPAMRARSLAVLAHLALTDADQQQSLERIREAREILVRFRLGDTPSAGPVVVASALGYVLEGRFVDARREATRALRLTSLMRVAPAWNLVHGHLALARVFLELREPEQAEKLLDEADAAYSPPADSPMARRLMTETREALATMPASNRGAPVLSTAEMRVLQYLPTYLSLSQIADELFLSRHTVKSQAVSAYRKLDAHTRSEAVERARHAGLLPGR